MRRGRRESWEEIAQRGGEEEGVEQAGQEAGWGHLQPLQ